VPLADILHAYRIGFTELWEAIVQEARRGARTPSVGSAGRPGG
jgi:hypothetical protein